MLNDVVKGKKAASAPELQCTFGRRSDVAVQFNKGCDRLTVELYVQG